MKQDLASISFITGRCSFVPAGSIVVYRWPGPNRFNVLGHTKPTNEQALAAISEFCELEAERAQSPQRVEADQ
jgi:hypothetical protein